MDQKKPSRAYLLIKAAVRAAYPRMQVEGLENLPEEGAILVGNHCQMNGPIACELFFPDNRYTWCAGQMMHLKEVPGYAFQDFWSQKPAASRWFYRILSYAIAPLSVLIFNNANTIPVYRDGRLLATFRSTIDKLKQGAKVVIFPEYDRKYNNILYDFQEHFVDVARIYCARTQKELSFVPLYIAPKLKKMVLGAPIPYRADQPAEEERQRICSALKAEITRLACSLPPHTVIPYRNIPKRDYPCSLPLKEYPHEEAHC